MKKLDLLYNIASKKIGNNFDWMSLIFVMTTYGLVLLFNRDSIWSVYNFIKIIDSDLEPTIFGVIFITASIALLAGKILKKNLIISIGLAISSFVWALHALLFLFAVPTNGVWVMSLLPLVLSIKQAVKE